MENNMKNDVKVYSVVFLGQFTTGNKEILDLVCNISYDKLNGSVVEFRPLSEKEFSLVKKLAKENRSKVIYSVYDESLKGSVDMRVYDPTK